MRRARARLGLALLLLGALLGALPLHDRPPVAPGSWLAAASLEARYEAISGHRIYVINWSIFQVDGRTPFPMPDPFKTYVQDVRAYLQSA